MWQQIVDSINAFFNTPVPIICCSVGSLLIFVLTVISKTSIGKKALNKLTNQYKEITDSYYKAKADYEKYIQELKDDYEAKLALIQNKKEETEKLLLSIAENIHNKKVQELVEQYKEKIQPINVCELVEKKEYEIKSHYESELDELKSIIQQIKEDMKHGGKQENTDTIKEEI